MPELASESLIFFIRHGTGQADVKAVAPATSLPLSLPMNLTALRTSRKWNDTVLSFLVTGLFDLAQPSEGSSTLWHASGFPCF